MRSYPRNSPQAAARVVALALLADGHLGQAEVEALKRIDVAGRLELGHEQLMAVVHTLCDDLIAGQGAHWSGTRHLPRTQLLAMLDEIDDVGLRLILLQVCAALSECDRHLSDTEYELLCTLADHWDLPLPPLRIATSQLMRDLDSQAVA